MNKLTTHFISTMQGLFGLPQNAPLRRGLLGMEDIRQAMLDALGDEGIFNHPAVERRVMFAGDLQALWYLRSELMQALSADHGELVANEKMLRITRMFQGLLPQGMISRPAGLRR